MESLGSQDITILIGGLIVYIGSWDIFTTETGCLLFYPLMSYPALHSTHAISHYWLTLNSFSLIDDYLMLHVAN
jgi:hypothetical protein